MANKKRDLTAEDVFNNILGEELEKRVKAGEKMKPVFLELAEKHNIDMTYAAMYYWISKHKPKIMKRIKSNRFKKLKLPKQTSVTSTLFPEESYHNVPEAVAEYKNGTIKTSHLLSHFEDEIGDLLILNIGIQDIRRKLSEKYDIALGRDAFNSWLYRSKKSLIKKAKERSKEKNIPSSFDNDMFEESLPAANKKQKEDDLEKNKLIERYKKGKVLPSELLSSFLLNEIYALGDKGISMKKALEKLNKKYGTDIKYGVMHKYHRIRRDQTALPSIPASEEERTKKTSPDTENISPESKESFDNDMFEESLGNTTAPVKAKRNPFVSNDEPIITDDDLENFDDLDIAKKTPQAQMEAIHRKKENPSFDAAYNNAIKQAWGREDKGLEEDMYSIVLDKLEGDFLERMTLSMEDRISNVLSRKIEKTLLEPELLIRPFRKGLEKAMVRDNVVEAISFGIKDSISPYGIQNVAQEAFANEISLAIKQEIANHPEIKKMVGEVKEVFPSAVQDLKTDIIKKIKDGELLADLLSASVNTTEPEFDNPFSSTGTPLRGVIEAEHAAALQVLSKVSEATTPLILMRKELEEMMKDLKTATKAATDAVAEARTVKMSPPPIVYDNSQVDQPKKEFPEEPIETFNASNGDIMKKKLIAGYKTGKTDIGTLLFMFFSDEIADQLFRTEETNIGHAIASVARRNGFAVNIEEVKRLLAAEAKFSIDLAHENILGKTLGVKNSCIYISNKEDKTFFNEEKTKEESSPYNFASDGVCPEDLFGDDSSALSQVPEEAMIEMLEKVNKYMEENDIHADVSNLIENNERKIVCAIKKAILDKISVEELFGRFKMMIDEEADELHGFEVKNETSAIDEILIKDIARNKQEVSFAISVIDLKGGSLDIIEVMKCFTLAEGYNQKTCSSLSNYSEAVYNLEAIVKYGIDMLDIPADEVSPLLWDIYSQGAMVTLGKQGIQSVDPLTEEDDEAFFIIFNDNDDEEEDLGI